MIDRIRAWAEGCEGLRTVLLTGSRGRAGARVDDLSDYDVVLFFDDPEPWAAEDGWLATFGDPLIVLPETTTHLDRTVATRLVQYAEGHRIDFTLSSVELLRVLSILPELPPWLDAGYVTVWDPGRLSGTMVPPQGRGYAGRMPAPEDVVAVVEEFWWECLVVGKALVRDEPHAAAYSAEAVLRHDVLRRLLEWRASAATGWSKAAGPYGRGLDQMLPESLRHGEAPRTRESAADDWRGEVGWGALDRLVDHAVPLARAVCDAVGATYPDAVDRGARARLKQLRGGRV